MIATPLPTSPAAAAPPARDKHSDGAVPPAEGTRFAELLRQRRVDAAARPPAERPNPHAGTAAAAAAARGKAGNANADATGNARPPAACECPATREAAPADEVTAAETRAAHEAATSPLDDAALLPIARPLDLDLLPAPSQADACGAAGPTSRGRAIGARRGLAAADADDSEDAPAGAASEYAQEGRLPVAPAAAPAAGIDSARASPAQRGAEQAPHAIAGVVPGRPSEPAPSPAATPPPAALPFASPAFGELLGAQVSLFARDGLQQAELRLNPAEMGPIGVQIEIDGGEARVNFHAGLAPTREAIERALPELAAALRGEGLTLAGGGVFDRPSNADGGARGERGPGSRRIAAGAVAAAPATAMRGRAPLGAVDLYA